MDVTVYGNNDEPTDKVTEAYADQLNKMGLKAKPKILDGGVYFQTIGSAKESPQTGFANWLQDFPHPKNFFFLVDGKSIQPTNNQNFGNVDDPEITKGIAELNKEPEMTDEVAAQVGRPQQEARRARLDRPLRAPQAGDVPVRADGLRQLLDVSTPCTSTTTQAAASDKTSSRSRLDADRARRGGRARAEQREHRAAEAAAHDPRADRARVLAAASRRARRRRPRPRSRRAGSRARRRAARRARPGRRRAARATAASTRAFSLSTWRTRRSSGAGQPLGRVGRRVAQRADARAPRTPRGTPRAARCSPSPRATCSCAGVERDQRASSRRRSSGTARVDEVAAVEAQRVALAGRTARRAGRAGRSAAPTQSFSTREHSRASSRRSPSASPASASSASASAVDSAAEEDRPLPRGRSPAIVRRRAAERVAGRAQLARPSRARRRASPRRSRRGAASVEAVVLAEVGGVRLDRARRRAARRVTVTPRAIAKGRQRPSL